MRGAMDRSPSAHVAASCWTDQMGVLPSLQAALYSDHARDGSKGGGPTPSNPRRNFRSTSVSRPSGMESPAPLSAKTGHKRRSRDGRCLGALRAVAKEQPAMSILAARDTGLI